VAIDEARYKAFLGESLGDSLAKRGPALGAKGGSSGCALRWSIKADSRASAVQCRSLFFSRRVLESEA
jgi:hypothetical protein